MDRVSVLIAAVVLGGLLGPPALAQQPAPATPPSESEMPASQLIGKRVFNGDGQNIGTIEDVLIDAHSGQSRLVLSVGKFLGVGEKYVVVPIDRVSLEGNRMVMPGATQQMFANMSSFLYKRIERNEPN